MNALRWLPLAAMLIGVSSAPAASLRLMTYNVNYANPDRDSTLDEIAKADADIVLLQEITNDWKRALEKRFAKTYEHQQYRLNARAAGGFAVLSKAPIKTEEILASPVQGWFPAERLVLDSKLGSVQILHVHLRPAVDGGSWLKGFITTRPMRRREIETYWKKVARDMPTIVAGDYNEDATGSVLQFLGKQGLVRVETKGPTTWHRDPLELDIDHVMIDGKLSAKNGTVLDAGASDHRPVIVTIEPKS